MPSDQKTIVDEISLSDLYDDPYPIYRRLRTEAPVAWVPVANRYLVTRYDDIVHLERHPEIFIANEHGSLMTRIMGHTLLRKDGAAHRRERAAAEAPMRPRTVNRHWMPLFQRNADDLIDEFAADGGGDLFRQFAGPLAARNLALVLGLRDASDVDMQRWSQAMMDGGGNYADDPVVWERADKAAAEIDEAVYAAVRHVREHPDESVISSMVHAADPLTVDEIRANVKVFVGGGLNEPRDSISVAIWAVLTHPEIRAAVEQDPARWRAVFEEAIRWVAPIGMYPREVAQPVELGGVTLEPGSRLGVCIGSANRDESVFERPDDFDINRPSKAHIAFGGGPHFCLGTWVARAQVAQVALPTLFRRLPDLRLSDTQEVRLGGWVFRGLLNLPTLWGV
ncbi:cytochrome P450 [Phytohabitans flavus]|uniref:cytochrome P450 n=1 Tax=Phytohabitans flavus TaxID=1076124 RepID=UPI0031E5042D